MKTISGSRLGDIYGSLAIICFASAALQQASSIGGGYRGSILTPQTFPVIICWGIFLLALVNLLSYWYMSEQLETQVPDTDRKAVVVKFAVGLGLFAELAFYACVIEVVGYILATAFFIVISIFTLVLADRPTRTQINSRGAIKLILFALIFSAAVFYLFDLGFELALPRLMKA